MNWPGRALWPLVFLSACVGSERVEVRPPPLGRLPDPQAAAPPTYSLEREEEVAQQAQVEPPPIPIRRVGRILDAYPMDTLDEVVAGVYPEVVRDGV